MYHHILMIFPKEIRPLFEFACNRETVVNEIRIRADKPVLVMEGDKEWFLDKDGSYTKELCKAKCLTKEEVEKLVMHICQYSIYAFEEEMRQGYITVTYADTTTTPAGKVSNGKVQIRKDLAAIMAEHHIPYVGQTTYTGNFKDIYTKAEKAIYTPGAAFLNVLSPCPRGWGYEPSEMMNMCKLAVETCYWPLFEVVDGKWILSYAPKKKLPLEDFLRPQRRFKHLFKPGNEDLLDAFQTEVDKRWEELRNKCE